MDDVRFALSDLFCSRLQASALQAKRRNTERPRDCSSEELSWMVIDNPKRAFAESSMSDYIKSVAWLTDLHLEFCSHRTRNHLYRSINQTAGEIVIITGDLSAGPHRLTQYTELAEKIRKPVYFVLGNHDRYGTTFANAEAVVERVTTLFSHMVRLDGSQVIPLNTSVALIGVDGWANGLGGEGPTTKARINDFYQILDFATDPEPQVFRAMKERARKYSQALKPSLLKALKQYQTTIIATHVPPLRRCSLARRFP